MLPQTDALLGRAFNIGIGMTDKELAMFGVSVRSTRDQVEAQVAHFRRVAETYLHNG